MDMHEAFLRDILAHPNDETPRLIYADWLDEQGGAQDLARAALLRLEVTRAGLDEDDPRKTEIEGQIKQVRVEAGTDWLATLARAPIEACVRWEFRCPQQWEKLQLTSDARVRHCTACRKNVHYCTTINEAAAHAHRGNCVAVDAAVERQPGDLVPATVVTLGMVAPDWEPERLRRQRK
jgi:uncharacterized protein (TIGR02996 family)